VKNLFRSVTSKDIDVLHQLLLAEAVEGRFDPRLAQEPYRSGLRKNLNNIRKKGRRLDQDTQAQLLVWEKEGQLAGCLINSSILPYEGNEIWMIAVLPEFRGQGEGSRMNREALSCLHPRVDVFARCAPEAQVAYQMFLQRGFLPVENAPGGGRVLKLPKLGSGPAGQNVSHQLLEPFVEIPLRKK